MAPTRAEQLRRLNELLREALELPPQRRQGYVDGLAPADAPLQSKLRAMLRRSAAQADDFMREPLAVQALAQAAAPDDAPGDLVGPWRLLELLGEGGMATVWSAERCDGTLQRQVALKLPRTGWSPGLVQRMARERTLLAALEHPNIARLYDAGQTDLGRPWLALERVPGEPIDAHCRRHGLGVAAVVRLSLQVCDALAHAHARLIVHRDLKPANILVTPAGEVRLLDFGIGALLLDAAQGGPGALTLAHGRAVTPDYASPEQVADRPQTVATDVYSMGVVLYELLSGQRPYRLRRRSTAALEEAILEADVPLASSRCQDAARARQLRGDLDAVLAKALTKTPARRYQSVESLAADLRAWLEGRPVSAQAPRWSYLAGKFLRRHRSLALATTGVVVMLAAALALALAEGRRAEAQLRQGLAQMARSEALTELASYVLFENIARDETLTLSQLLERTGRFAEQRQLPLQRAVALQFLATWQQQRGELDAAEGLVEAARRGLPASLEGSVGAQLACLQADILSAKGHHQDAGELARRTLRELSEEDLDTRTYCLLALASSANRRPGGATESELAARQGLDLLEGAGPAHLRRRALLGSKLAWMLSERGEWLESDRLFQRSWTQLAFAGASDGQEAAALQANWAGALLQAGRPAAAHQRYEEAHQALRRRSPDGDGHPVLQLQLAKALSQMGHDGRAVRQYAEAVDRARATGNRRIETAARLGMGSALWALGRSQEAADELAAAVVLAPDVVEDLRASSGVQRVVLEAQLAHSRGRRDEGIQLLQRALVRQQAVAPDAVLRVPLVLALAELQAAAGQPQASREPLERALAAERHRQPEGWPSARVGELQLALGQVYLAGGDVRAASMLVDASRELSQAAGDSSPRAVHARAWVAAAAAAAR